MESAKRFVELYAPKAYAMAMRLTGNHAEASDLAQNAMLRVMKRFSTYDPSLPFEPWLYRIVRNAYMDRLRLESRRKEDPLHASGIEGALSPAQRLVDPHPGPEQELDREARRDAVQAAILRLPLDMRMPVALVDLEGMRYDEAARALEIPCSTLGVRLHRARRRLKELLAEAGEGGR